MGLVQSPCLSDSSSQSASAHRSSQSFDIKGNASPRSTSSLFKISVSLAGVYNYTRTAK